MGARRAAAVENAQWCDLVCTLAHLGTSDADGVWAAATRSPSAYPDAVTTSPGATAAQVLARVDAGPGCSVKDSFAVLDLAPWGFEVLFEARWVHRPAERVTSPSAMAAVRTPAELEGWRAAHGGAEALGAALLDDPSVLVLASGEPGRVLSGAVGHLGGLPAAPVVGVSNVFSAVPGVPPPWPDVVRALGVWAPGTPLVGYESGDDLAAALAAGSTDAGPLRVWHRPG